MISTEEQRRHLQEQRRQLSPAQQSAAAQHVLERVIKQHVLDAYQHIAFYYPVQGELDPRPIIEYAWTQGKTCYLPILQTAPNKVLHFAPYSSDALLQPNRYGIPEPQQTEAQCITGEQLELVFVPLVAFDTKGNRLGMGAGFYDTTFAFTQKNCQDVQLIGLAYEFQRVHALNPQPWDIPLDTIITEETLCNTGS